MQSERMNRQAKLKSDSLDDRDWTDMGARTIIDAAEKFVELNVRTGNMSFFPPRLNVQVRDQDQPNVVHEFMVYRQISYKVVNPRQGAE